LLDGHSLCKSAIAACHYITDYKLVQFKMIIH
jgi:hypothetical protein